MDRSAFTFDFKAADDGAGTFSGYGSVFGNVDMGRDVVVRGAFSATLADWRVKGKWPKLLWQHDTRQPIGVWTDMVEDDYGLRVSGRFTLASPKGAEAYALLKDGALDGLSIGYAVRDDEWDRDTNVRRLKAVDLFEVSIVTIPMNPAAAVTAVKDHAGQINPRELEAEFRRIGLSRDVAVKAVAAVKEHLRRDDGGQQSAEARDETGRLSDVLAALKAGRPST